MRIEVVGGGRPVVSRVMPQGPSRYKVSFTPTSVDRHTVDISFNNVQVPGKSTNLNYKLMLKIDNHYSNV